MGIKPKDSQRDTLTKRGRQRHTEQMWHKIDPVTYYIVDDSRRDHNT